MKFSSSWGNTVGNLCSPFLLLVQTSWPGWDLVPVGCWELLRPPGSLPAPMAHGQLSMHCSVQNHHNSILHDSRMSTLGDQTTPTQLFPFQPKRIPFLQHLIEIGPSTFFVPKAWAIVLQQVFWWVICILVQHNLQCFSWGSDCADKWGMFICWIEKKIQIRNVFNREVTQCVTGGMLVTYFP